MNLTHKQQVFVFEYLQCFNATEAARRAGYSGDDNTLAVIGWENIRKPKIAELIERRLQEKAMSADEVLVRLAEQARGDIANFINITEDGFQIDLKKAKNAGLTHLVKRIGYNRHGKPEIELYDAQAALVQLGKYHKLFTDKVEHSGSGQPIPIALVQPGIVQKLLGGETSDEGDHRGDN